MEHLESEIVLWNIAQALKRVINSCVQIWLRKLSERPDLIKHQKIIAIEINLCFNFMCNVGLQLGTNRTVKFTAILFNIATTIVTDVIFAKYATLSIYLAWAHFPLPTCG